MPAMGRRSIMEAMRNATWPLWAQLGLGLWMTALPFQLGGSEELIVAGLFAGMAVFGLSLFSLLHPPLRYLAFLNSFIGLALMALPSWPLWVGPAVVALALARPALTPPPRPDCPPGWFHNPSAWIQRAPMAALAVIGALGARGDGVGQGLALLAAAAVLTGDRRRWETAPWAALLSAAAAAASSAAALSRLAFEPGPGPAAAFLSGALVLALAADELSAARMYVRHAGHLGQRFWDAVLRGGLLPADDFMPRPDRRPAWCPPRRHSRRKRRI
jgi:hypothetical protein